MKACTMVNGGVMFVPDTLERKTAKASEKLSNDNKTKTGKKAESGKKPLTGKKSS